MLLKNKKGFNLFTALISLMLISIVIVFIYNMVQTEENYLSLINDQSKTSDLITIADISRADAFNVFVVSFRDQYIFYRNQPANYIVIDRDSVVLPWDEFVDHFANTIFFDRQFEDFFATYVVESLNYVNPPIGYSIEIPDYNKQDLSRIIKEAFDNADNKIEVVGCENNNNCIGSLYFTIDTRNLSADDYEKLPMLVISRNVDDEVIQRPVFARREYRIYLPWRAFQSMRTIRNYALGTAIEDKENKEDIVDGLYASQGLFNINIYNALNSARLGVCDIDSCALRSDLFKTVDTTGYTGSDCKNPPVMSGIQANNGGLTVPDITGTINLTGNHNYNLQAPESLQPIYEDLIETTIKNNLDDRGDILYAGSDLLAINTSSNTECENPLDSLLDICNVIVQRKSPITTKSATANIISDANPQPLPSSTFNFNNYNYAWNLGLYRDVDSNFSRVDDTSSILPGPDNQYLQCHKLESIKLLFKFEEQNEKYIITNNSHNIYIRLEDTFPNYSFYDNPLTLSLGYFNNYNYSSNISNGWSCTSYEPVNILQAGCVAQ